MFLIPFRLIPLLYSSHSDLFKYGYNITKSSPSFFLFCQGLPGVLSFFLLLFASSQVQNIPCQHKKCPSHAGHPVAVIEVLGVDHQVDQVEGQLVQQVYEGQGFLYQPGQLHHILINV